MQQLNILLKKEKQQQQQKKKKIAKTDVMLPVSFLLLVSYIKNFGAPLKHYVPKFILHVFFNYNLDRLQIKYL